MDEIGILIESTDLFINSQYREVCAVDGRVSGRVELGFLNEMHLDGVYCANRLGILGLPIVACARSFR